MNEPNEIEHTVAAGVAGTGGSALTVGSLVAGRFVLLAHLGHGRFGPIFEAVDRALSGSGPDRERRVALHAIADGAAADELAAELEKWRAAPQAWLHPNVVKVLDFGLDDGHAFVLTELLDGLTLRRVLDDIAPELLAMEESLAITGKVGAALNYAHAKGAVHGDLRPETVFVTTGFSVKVLDFWPLRPASTTADDGDDDDARATARSRVSDDVYGLACLAYELLTGRHPFNANSPHEARRAGLAPAPIVGLPQGRWQAIARGLELDSDERTPTVADFLAELGVSGRETLPMAGRSAAPHDRRLDGPPDGTTRSPPSARYAGAARARIAPVRPRHESPEAGTPALRAPVRAPRRGKTRAPRRRRSGAWLFLLPVALVAALAFAVLRDYDEMRGAVTELIAAGSARVEQLQAPAATAATPDTNAAVAQEAAPSVESASDAAPRAPGLAEQTAAASSASAESRADTRPLERTAAAAPRRGPQGLRAASESSPSDTAVASARPAAASPATPSFELAEARVTVTEGDALARVTIRHAGASEAPVHVFWWTGGHTAQPGDDYADLEGTETIAAGESRDVLIPLADDVWPEGAESFFLYVGVELQRRRTQTPVAQAEVSIVDDDL
jgi:hypothetical protein